MVQRPPALAVLRQGLPLALGMASHALFNLVDLVLVGQLGSEAVAGVHVATTVNFLPMILGNGISIAVLSMLARSLGGGDEAGARELSSRAQSYMLLLGVVVGVLGAAVAAPCVDLQGVVGEARDIGLHYLVVTSLGTVTMFALIQTTASMRALGEGAMPLLLLVGGNALNLVLDVILMFGWDALSIPAFGAPGAAYATVIARALAAGVGVWWLRRPGYRLRFTWVPLRGPRGQLAEILRLGLPQSLQMLVRALAVIALTRVAAELGGQDAIAALGVTTRLDTLVLFAALGFASAGTTVAGTSHGAGEAARARGACAWAGVWALAFSAILVAVFAALARPLIGLFIDGASEGVLAAGALYLTTAALGQPLAAFSIAVTGGVNGTGRVWPPMILDLAVYLTVLFPGVIVVAASAEDGGLAGVWWVCVVANLLLAAAYAVYLRRAGFGVGVDRAG